MSAGIRHMTASAIVLDDDDRVLLVRHLKSGLWLYPGGHLEGDEEPAAAAVRETVEETGLAVEVITDPLFAHPAVVTHPAPFAVIEMPVSDKAVGPHHHIDMVYVCRPVPGDAAPVPQLTEVSSAVWVPAADVATLRTPAELPGLIGAATVWAKARR
ncbi:NUDIX hydrolase [Micromonospora sp. DT227]|uniref:NUDIX hydrolase n=1 Tax=Micromonospora sp. DT227 TaxID=3393433 RepID=UPI003CF9795C